MSLVSHLIQRLLKLPPPVTRSLLVERDLRVPMADGVELLADRWLPRRGGESLPTALIRTPYGRRGLFGAMMARPLAERGFQVLLQSTRAVSAPAARSTRCGRSVQMASRRSIG
jgi:predicted acyl esterase